MAKRRILDDLQKVPKILERGSVTLGDIQGADNYVVHGEVYGDSDIQGTLMLAEDCRWKGNIIADVVVVKGRVEGEITANTKIELRDSAQVTGELRAPIVAIAHGATVRGEVHEDSFVTHFQERRIH